MAQPTGWRVIAASATAECPPLDLGVELRVPPSSAQRSATKRLREFATCVTRALESGWRPAELHRSIDAAYWGTLSDMFDKACSWAFRAKITEDHVGRATG